MAAGNPSIMVLTGGTSTSVAGAGTVWNSNLSQTPFAVTVESVMNSTAAAPNYSVVITNDVQGGLITASSSSASAFNTTSTTAFANSSVTWFSSLAATNSSNSLVTITAPFRYLTLVASAGSSAQTITATITQVG